MAATEQIAKEVEEFSSGGPPPQSTSGQQPPQSTSKDVKSSSSKRLEVSWERDLNKYVAETNRSQQSLESVRTQLALEVIASPQSADTWWAFLHHEEVSNPEASSKPKQRTAPGIITLFDLYDWSARLVPQKGNKTKASFVNIWLGHARQQCLRGKDDALDAIKALKTQQIGLQYAPMYAEWAGLEAASGNTSKALSVVSKGLKEGATPKSILEDMSSALKAGTYTYAPFWALLDAEHINRNQMPTIAKDPGPHSNGASQPLNLQNTHAHRSSLTPSWRDDQAPLATPTLTMTNNTRPHFAQSMVSHSQGPSAHHHSATMAATAPRTNQSMHSASTGRTTTTAATTATASGDPTATMPTLGSSTSSTSDEATLHLRSAHNGGRTGPVNSSAKTSYKPQEETIIINRSHGLSVLQKPQTLNPTTTTSAATTSAAAMTTPGSLTACTTPKDPSSSSMFKPRNGFSSLGKALRITPTTGGDGGENMNNDVIVSASSLSNMAATTTTSAAAAAIATVVTTTPSVPPTVHAPDDIITEKKRKAIADAIESPKSMLSAGEGKRRSPCEHDAMHRVPSELTPIPESPRALAALAAAAENNNNNNAMNTNRRQIVLDEDNNVQGSRANVDDETAPVSKNHNSSMKDRVALHTSNKPTMNNNNSIDPDATIPLPRPVQSMPPPAQSLQQQQPAAAPAPPPKPTQAPSRSSTRRIIEDENSVVVRDIKYTKLECVGRGGSSKVFKVMAPNKKIFALKRIRLNGRDAEAATGFLDEITLLTKLNGRSNIIQLVDSEVHKAEGLIYMVLEYGDIDLAKLLQRHEASRKERAVTGSQNGQSIDENFIRLYWEQMLHAVDTIHRERIVHSDLKPANFLVVEGQLKLIDFGIAKAIQNDTTSIARESQVGTLNYMSPEAILGGHSAPPNGGAPMKVGRASDIWSLGCILYQMVYGKTPFAHLPFIQKMQAIIDHRHQIEFPSISNTALVEVIKRCLDRHPGTRATMLELLEHPFLRPAHATAGPQGMMATPNSVSSSGSGVRGSVELSKEQLRRLLLKVSQAGVSDAEVSSLSEQLFTQLSHGDINSPDVMHLKTRRPLMPPPPPRQSGVQGGGDGGESLENENNMPIDGAGPVCRPAARMPLMPLSDAALAPGVPSLSSKQVPTENNVGHTVEQQMMI